MKMIKTCAIALTLVFSSVAMAESTTTLQALTWGGRYEEAQHEMWFDPFEKIHDVEIQSQSGTGSLARLKAEIESGNPQSDLIDMSTVGAIKGCEQGLLEPIGHLFNKDNYLEGAIMECAVAQFMFTTNIAVREDATEIRTVEDFFNPDIPGKRGMKRQPRQTLEFALLGDGVKPENVYDVLRTEEGVERAFAVLDRIEDKVIWWEASDQAPQLLMNGSVVATTVYNSRMEAYLEDSNDTQNAKILWDAQHIRSWGWFGVSSKAPNKDLAIKFVEYLMEPEVNARLVNHVSYAPTMKKDLQPELSKKFPSHPDNLKNSFSGDGEFWANNNDRLTERFSAWVSK